MKNHKIAKNSTTIKAREKITEQLNGVYVLGQFTRPISGCNFA
jgi:hypothetical protein